MSTHHVETKIKKDGSLTLKDLPFRPGESVEVIVVSHSSKPAGTDRYPLRGTPIQYSGPTEPVEEEDWEAMR